MNVLGFDPMWFILGLLLLFVFFVYLMIRRTVVGFKEGMQESRKR